MRAFIFSPALWVLVDAIATFRLARLVTTDVVFERQRQWVKRTFKGGKAFYFITCPWCTSIWLAAGVVAATRFEGGIWAYAAAGLAFSGVAGFLAER